jgi:hypothetical protein
MFHFIDLRGFYLGVWLFLYMISQHTQLPSVGLHLYYTMILHVVNLFILFWVSFQLNHLLVVYDGGILPVESSFSCI